MLSISTYWLGEDEAIEGWLQKIQSYGFDAVELGYRTTHENLKEFELLLKKYKIHVSSLHNFCPAPNDGATDRHPSNHYRLSAVDEPERLKAVEWTNHTIDTARRLGAEVVVIHAGTMDFEDIRAPYFFDLLLKGKSQTPEFRIERERILKARQEKRPPHIVALEKSLKSVTDYAKKNQIKIGLETRYYPIEMPNFDEIEYFLKMFGPEVMGYWHDVGHAQMNEKLGITPHLDFLNTYQDRLIGVHLHGISGKRDHMAPFHGDMDLAKLMPYFGPDIIRVVETKYATEAELIKAVGLLKQY